MITHDGWFDWAERVTPPLDTLGRRKVNGGRNAVLGLAAHSAEGWEGYLRSQGGAARRASWPLSNLLAGKLLQHYSIFDQCWTSGSPWPNNNLVGMESEGLAGTPITPAQVETVKRVINDLRAFTGRMQVERIGSRNVVPAGIFAIVEHGECVRWGSEATACPSGRYPWDAILPAFAAAPILSREDGLAAIAALAGAAESGGRVSSTHLNVLRQMAKGFPPAAQSYTREQGLWAVAAWGWIFGIAQWQDPPVLHGFDQAVIADLIARAA